MERQVIFRDRQEITQDDLNNIQDWSQEASDHVVKDALHAGRRFTGFAVTQATANSVNIAEGRLYYDGARYFRADPGGVVIDLNQLRPALQKKIVSIVAWPQTQDTDVQERDFEIDAEQQTFEPQAVAMERRRRAILEATGGAEAVAPQPPVIDANSVVIAFVTMGPAGIEKIERNDAKLMPNLGDVSDEVEALAGFREVAEPQIQSMKSDLARVAVDLAAAGNKELLLNAAADIASIKARLDIPDTYTGYRALSFMDETLSNKVAAGYAAHIEEGLRFPKAASDEQALALLNINQANARVSAGGLLMPAYTEIERRITKGDDGSLNLNEYSNQEARALTRLAMGRERIRFGGDFEVTVGSSWWAGGTYSDRANGSIRGVFQREGETFQVYETGKVDQDGHRIVRLAKYWTDSVAAPYWSRLTTEDNVLGYAHVETYLNPQDRWVTGLGPHMKGKPANGALIVGICETYRGEPDFSRILAMTTVQAENVQLVSVSGAFPKIAIEPTFLKGGERYGYFIVTASPFQIGVADAQNAMSQGVTGTYFYGVNGGAWFAEPAVHLLWRDWSAQFPKASVDIDLQPIQLVGGIQAIDLMADAIVPGSTDLVVSVQLGGQYRALDAFDPDILATLPPLLPMRLTFVGTQDVMPGIRLEDSSVGFSRLATAAKHVSVQKALPATTSTITLKIRMRGFDPAHHTIVPKISYGAGPTVETADVITTQTFGDGTVEKVATFNLAAATNAYVSTLELATDSVQRPFTVSEVVEIAA